MGEGPKIKETNDWVALQNADFVRFETTPDDVLFIDELSESQRQELVERFVRTDSKSVRDYFLERMSFSIWKDIRDRLISLSDSTGADPNLQKRANDLLAHEFADNRWRFSFYTNYSASKGQSTTNNDGYDDSGRKYTDNYVNSGKNQMGSGGLGLRLNQPFAETWRFRFDPQLRVSKKFDFQKRDVSTNLIGAESTESKVYNGSPWGMGGQGNLGVFSINNMYRTSMSGEYLHTFSPLPDTTRDDLKFNGSFEIRKPEQIPFTLNGSVNGLVKNYAPSLYEDLNTRKEKALTIQGESTYQLENIFGFVAEYGYTRESRVGSNSLVDKRRHSGAILAQLNINDDVIRFGAGGGIKRSFYRLRDRAEHGQYDVGETYLTASYDRKFADWISADFEGEAYANYVEGTLNGWYPEWYIGGSLVLSPEGWSITVMPGWDCAVKQLYYDQEEGDAYQEVSGEKNIVENELKLNLDIKYTPSDSVEIEGLVTGFYNFVNGFQSQEELSVDSSLSLSFRLMREPATVWLWLGGGYGGGLYNTHYLPRSHSDWSSYWGNIGASLVY